MRFRKRQRVRVKATWSTAGRIGYVLGPSILLGTANWTPVLWDDEEDPDWHKTDGLELLPSFLRRLEL